MKYFIDVHKTATKRKPHVIYDGKDFIKVRSLKELPLNEGDEIYMDVLTPHIFDDVSLLLRKVVKVYTLKRLDKLPKYRQANGLEKSDENDARTLSHMSPDEFKEVTAEYIELKKLIHRYNAVSSTLKTMKQLNSVYTFQEIKQVLRHLRRLKDKIAGEIIRAASKALPQYNHVVKELNLSPKCLYGKVALAYLLTSVDFRGRFRSQLCLFGLYKPHNGRYNHRLHQALGSLTISVTKRRRIKAKDMRTTLKTVRDLLRAGGWV